MARVKLPFNTSTYKSADKAELTVQGDELLNGYINELEHTVKRPGYNVFVNLLTEKKIDGLYLFKNVNRLIAVSNGKVYSIDSNGTKTDITGVGMDVGTHVIFSEGVSGSNHYLFMANGGRIKYTDGLTALQVITDEHASSFVDHVATIDLYLLVNQINTAYWDYCGSTAGVIDPLVWGSDDGGGTNEAEAIPDKLLAIHVAGNEAYLFGEKSIEVWYNQGVSGTPFARIGGAYINVGVGAKYSIQFINNTFYFITNERRVARISGRNYEYIDFPYYKEIQGFTSIDDAIGYNIIYKGRSFYCINFVSAGRTFVLDYSNNKWFEWTTFNKDTGEQENFIATCSEYAEDWNKHLIGGNDGKIYVLSDDIFSDNNNTIYVKKVTGNINHNSSKMKVSSELSLTVKTGSVQLDTEPSFTIRTRDNNSNQWGEPIVVNLGQLGDTENVKRLMPMGTYISRQYELVFTDNAPFILIDVEEDVRVING